ncbi:MAG: hypothetical protein J5685_03215 [Clostridiales bacterium]|nr:hypothetical protein [Clostridiales bacterium]
MTRPCIRCGSIFLAIALSGTFLISGCSGKKQDDTPAVMDEAGLVLSGVMPDTLPEGLSWYDFKEDTSLFDLFDGMYDNYMVNNGNIVVRGDRTWVYVSEYGFDSSTDHLISIDDNGQIVTDEVIGDDLYVVSFLQGENLYMRGMDYTTGDDMIYRVDEETGTIDADDGVDLADFLSPSDYVVSDEFSGEDLVFLVSGGNYGDTYKIVVGDLTSGSVKNTVELEDIERLYNIEWLEGMMCAGTGKAVIWGATSSNNDFANTRYVVVDLTSGQTSALDEKEYINIPLRNLSSFGGRLVSITDAGVYQIDLDNDTCSLLLSFNCSNCNRYLVNNSELKYVDDNRLVFSYFSREAAVGQLHNAICEFRRSDSYPAAGKTVLTVASTEDLDYSISEAIMRFNDTSDTAFLLFDGRYKANNEIDYSNSSDTDTAVLGVLGSYASVSDRLAMDIISGNGPDILISSGANERLSRSEYFLDLSDIADSLNGSAYFMNAIEASRYNGALYQFPIGFYVDGFMSSSDSFGGRNGMTFDTYDGIVDTVCNGADPVYDHQLSYSRTEVATTLFANMHELFISDGRIDVGNDAFRAILDYCKDLPSEPGVTDEDLNERYEDYMYECENLPVVMDRFDGFDQFERNWERFGDITICGLPSVDGRSASVGSDLAVSISSQSEDQEACRAFLNILLTEDIQRSIQDCIPVSRDAARELFVADMEESNRWIEEGGYGEEFGVRPYDLSLADRYVEQVSLATTSSFVDNSIALIIYEEVPGYFEGQKTFDEVVGIINDRAQTVLDERN